MEMEMDIKTENKMADGHSHFSIHLVLGLLVPGKSAFDLGDLIEWNMPCSDCNFIKVAALGALAVVVHHRAAS